MAVKYFVAICVTALVAVRIEIFMQIHACVCCHVTALVAVRIEIVGLSKYCLIAVVTALVAVRIEINSQLPYASYFPSPPLWR